MWIFFSNASKEVDGVQARPPHLPHRRKVNVSVVDVGADTSYWFDPHVPWVAHCVADVAVHSLTRYSPAEHVPHDWHCLLLVTPPSWHARDSYCVSEHVSHSEHWVGAVAVQAAV